MVGSIKTSLYIAAAALIVVGAMALHGVWLKTQLSDVQGQLVKMTANVSTLTGAIETQNLAVDELATQTNLMKAQAAAALIAANKTLAKHEDAIATIRRTPVTSCTPENLQQKIWVEVAAP